MTTKAYVDIHGRNKTDRAFNKVESNVSRLDNSFKKLNTGIAAFGTGIALLKLVSLGKSSIDSADKIDKLSTRLGASSEALSQYRHVASQAGIEFNTLTMGWQRMTRRVAEAAKGTGEAKGALIELGISAKALNKLAPDQQFEALADALQKVENPADRVRLSMKLFDSEGVSLIQTMKGGAAGIREMREEADRLGLTLSEKQTRGAADAKDAIDRLTSSISGAFSQAVLDNIGFIETFAQVIADIKPIALGMIGEFMVGLEHLKAAAKVAGEGLKLAFVAPIAFITDSFGEMVTRFGKFSSIFGENDISLAIKDFGKSIKNTLNPIDNFNKKVRQIKLEKDKAIAATRALTMEMMDEAGAAKAVTKALVTTNTSTVKLAGSTMSLANQQKILSTVMNASKKAANQLATATGVNLLKSQAQLNKAVAQAQLKHVNYNKALQAAHNTVIKQAAPGTKAYTRLMQALGFTVAKTASITVKSTTLMSTAWQRFGSVADNALQRFFRSGLKDTKSFTSSIKDFFKDMIAEILAEITKLLAKNAFKKFLAFVTGKSQTTSLFSGLGNLLGLGGGSSSGGSSSGGMPSVSPTSLLSVGAKIAKGAKTAWAAVTKAGSLLKSGATKLLGSIPGWGQAALAAVAVFAIAKKVFGGGRSPQELAEDQLSAVDQATKEGRNEQVQLGQAAGTAVSFLGGFDEFSTFFGIDKAKADIQQIGDIFKANFGGDALLAVKDGILRIEDKSRKFSENNEEIVAQVKASIIEFELQFTKTEKSILASLGSSITGVDELFDSMKDSGLSTSEKLVRSYSQFFNKTKAEGEQWLASSGLQADRWAQIFDSATGPVLSQLVGLGNAGVQSFNDIANSATSLSSDIIGLNDVLSETARRQSNIVPIGSQKPTNIPQIPSGDNVVPINGAQDSQANGNQGLSPDAAAIVAEMREQTEEMRAARTAPGGR